MARGNGGRAEGGRGDKMGVSERCEEVSARVGDFFA